MRKVASAFFCLLLACRAAEAATASGRNWRIDIGSVVCEGNLLAISARIDYLGPKGLVEAPVNRLVDGEGRTYLARSLIWKSGDRRLAQWLPAGGIANVQSPSIGEFQFKFDVSGATSALRLEFGDIRSFALTRKGGCSSVLKPGEIEAPRRSRPASTEPAKVRVYRAAYPCAPQRIVEFKHPPHLPRQLLVLGHGFLPNAREIHLPLGKAPAQSYAYNGPDNLDAVEDAARRVVAADFPQYRSERFFFFNWGVQKALSGNDVYSIGIYDLRPCAK